jgi:hypothetical protein
MDAMQVKLVHENNAKLLEWEQLREAASKWKEELSNTLGSTLTEDASTFVKYATRERTLSHYKHFDANAKSIVAKIQKTQGDISTRQFLKLTIAAALVGTIEKRRLSPLPTILNRNQLHHFRRILSQRDFSDDWLGIEEDLFQKEFGLAAERLYASGSQLLDRNCGVPRSIIFKEGITKILGKLMFFSRLKGFKPMVQIHTHTFNLDKFNEGGWVECYMGCVELYQIYPNLLGVFGSSWFFDPAVVKISPRLEYLRSIPSHGGARFHFFSSDGSAVANATSTSESRKKLYQDGKYKPKNYAMIWGKDAQIEWCKARLDNSMDSEA